MPDHPVTSPSITLQRGDALLVTDIQTDFLPGGRLAVAHGDEVVPVLNGYIAAFRQAGLTIIATRDWHPPDHCSFRAQGGPWPLHCVAGSPGAGFAAMLELPCEAPIVSKASKQDREAYSSFQDTELDALLRQAGIERVFVGGLTTDYCVLNTVRDALKLGYQAVVLLDAIRAVDVHAGDGERAIAEMLQGGAIAATLKQLSR